MKRNTGLLWSSNGNKNPKWVAEYGKLSDIDESDIFAVKEKQECYNTILRSQKRLHDKLVADAWCSSFFWPLNEDAPPPPTEVTLRMIQKNMKDGNVDSRTKSMILELANEYRFFHWHLEFPEVFYGEKTGFDCVLGNPPWEELQAEEASWFVGKDEEVSQASSSKRKELIAELEIKNPKLFSKWKNYQKAITLQKDFFKKSNCFPFSAQGKINTYPLFTELAAINLINRKGRAGIVVKTGIATDYFTRYLFSYIIENKLLQSLYDFVNSEGIFPDVAPPERFCLLTLNGNLTL